MAAARNEQSCPCQVRELSQSSIPKLFQRPGPALTTASERELPLANAMRKLNAGQCDGRSSERLELHHWGAATFDRAMILLDDVVEVAAIPHDDVLPPRILCAQLTQRSVAPTVTVERHLARQARYMRATAFLKNARAASLLRSRQSRKSTVLPYLSTARYK